MNYALLKQMRDKLVETATPGQELMAGTLRDRAVYLDAKTTQAVNNGLTLDEVLRTPVHIHVVNLLVELVCISEDTIVSGLYVEAEDSTAEGTHPGKLIHVVEDDIEGLVTTP